MRKFQARAFTNSSRPPASGVRGATDSLVQGSLVDLFAAYGVAVAPLPRTSGLRATRLPDVSAVVGFTQHNARAAAGKLTLSLPGALLDLMSPGAQGALKGDWARELANQLLGRIKNRLLPFNVRLAVGVSSLVESSKLAQQLPTSADLRVYTARALRGEVVLTLQGLPEDSLLSYIGPAITASEGDAILF